MKSLPKVLVCVLVCLCLGAGAFAGGSQEARAEKVRLVIWEWITTQGPGPVYQEILQSYRVANPTVEVESISDPWNQAHDKVLLMHQADRMPDIIGVNRNWLVEFVALGIIADLSPYVDKVPGMRDKYYDAVKGEMDGKVWILPYDGGNAAFVYNTAKFAQAGLAVPDTFDQFMGIAPKLTDAANNKFATQFCIAEKNVTGAHVCNIGPVLTSFGGTYVKDRKAAFNSPEGVQAFQWMIDLEKNGLAAPGGITVDAKNMREAFASERVYTTFDGAWGVTFYNNFPDLKWDVSRMLKKKDVGTVVNIMCWGMAKSSKNPDAAWNLLSHIQSDDMLLKYFRDGNVMPSTKKHGALPEFQTRYKGFLDTYAQTTNYFQTGSVAQESELYRILVEAYHKAFLGQMSVKTALDEAAAKYNTAAEEFYARYR